MVLFSVENPLQQSDGPSLAVLLAKNLGGLSMLMIGEFIGKRHNSQYA
jgi:hypothetical protein